MITVTVKAQVDGLPLSSVKVYVTVVDPIGNRVPGAWERENKLTTPERSTAVGSTQVTVFEVVPSSVTSVRSIGQFWIVGGIVSSVENENCYMKIAILSSNGQAKCMTFVRRNDN